MSIAQYTGRKSLAAIAASAEGRSGGLAKTLGPFSLIGLGIGCIIGAGIFVLTGKAAASYAGPAISLSFVLAGVACAFVGLCYAELAAMIPVVGQRLHLCLCDRRRDLCLDHRLGPDPRIRDGRRDRRCRLVRLLRQSARQFRHPHPGTMGAGDRRGGEARRWNIGNRHRQSTGRADRPGCSPVC